MTHSTPSKSAAPRQAETEDENCGLVLVVTAILSFAIVGWQLL